MNSIPRAAFFTDCFYEVNGVALTSRQLEDYARKREYPFFSLHTGRENLACEEGSITRCELRRGPIRFRLDSDMAFDLAFLRHRGRVRDALERFQPDLIHITGPGDCGILGAVLAHELRVPLVCSWHTNVHEFGRRRLERLAAFLPSGWREKLGESAEKQALDATVQFYRLGRVLMAPNAELVRMLRQRTGRPTFLMQRGVDTQQFDPRKRSRTDDAVVIGYVGRLTAEKNVRVLVDLEIALQNAGISNYRFLVIGQGSERAWLSQSLRQAEFAGVLRGEELARAYASMDIFVFPSKTDTFGNVILEALASGVPAVVTGGGGPKYLVHNGITGFVGSTNGAFLRYAMTLVADSPLRSQMSAAARQYALNISWDAVMQKVYAAYAECLRSADATPAATRTDPVEPVSTETWRG